MTTHDPIPGCPGTTQHQHPPTCPRCGRPIHQQDNSYRLGKTIIPNIDDTWRHTSIGTVAVQPDGTITCNQEASGLA